MSLSGASLDEVFERARAFRVRILPIETAHLLQLGLLPRLHKDPFDRILIAQSRAEQRPLVTVDRDIERYDVQTIW